MHAHTVFVGKLQWRYRWRAMAWALKAVWLGFRGYYVSVQLCAESPEEAARYHAMQEAADTLKHAPGSLTVN